MRLLGPSSTTLLVISLVLAVLVTTVTVAFWDRGVLRMSRRIVGLTLSQAFLLLAAFVFANQQISFYASWSDLFGGH
ncbi:hypothetical protein CLV47_10837 [Antricoccus suffuscus]|uniref:Uncharacterized protein n=1 Tax=Antricoccus suffuscus TaxID=1629062 RepID=A0A2T1A010_9ACTN|nr:hypothetical protein [Antricoccus suffuscus]PRZ41678.1 hypothetical protein CLV47_10837 [Antricoccus suffuscus]